MPLNKTVSVFLPFALGYFLSYIFRVVNAVIAPDLVIDLNLNSSQLGLLTSVYFISFASSQLALGLLLDRFGPRIINSILLIFAGMGALIFAQSHSLTGVIIGRAFIGFGVSACLMAALKAYVLWFPKKMWPRINGFQMAAGGLGALAATSPVAWLLQVTDWRGVFMGLAGLCFFVSAVLWKVVPEKARSTAPESLGEQLKGVKQIFTSRDFWRTAPVTTMSQAGLLSIQGLWVGPWLKDVGGMDSMSGAALLSGIALSMMAGFIGLGYLAERLNQRGIPILTTAISGMAVFMVIQGFIVLEVITLAPFLWLLFGFFGTSGILAYAGLSRQFSSQLSGRVTTAINLLVFLTAFAAQWAMGAIINLWETGVQGSYAPAGYQAAFCLMLIFQVLGLLWFFIAPVIFKRQIGQSGDTAHEMRSSGKS